MTRPRTSPTPEFDTATQASTIARRIMAERRYNELLTALGMYPAIAGTKRLWPCARLLWAF